MRTKYYPKFNRLTHEQQATFGNGCGTKWMPKKLINIMFGWFFEASCRHHDFGYAVGGNEFRRWHCDKMFYRAMLRDTKRIKSTPKRILAILASGFYYSAVVLFGWTSFAYGTPNSLQEVLRDDK